MEAGAGCRGGADGRTGIRSHSISVRIHALGEQRWVARRRASGHGRRGGQARRRDATRDAAACGSTGGGAGEHGGVRRKTIATCAGGRQQHGAGRGQGQRRVKRRVATARYDSWHGLGGLPQAHDGGSPTDDSPTQPDTKKCIQVGRDTYALTSQPGTSYTFDRGIDTGTFQRQRSQPVTNPVCDDYDSIVVIDSSGPTDHVHSGKKKRLHFRNRKKKNTNVPNSDRTTP